MSGVTRKYQFAFVPGSNWWAVEEWPALDFCCFVYDSEEIRVVSSKKFEDFALVYCGVPVYRK